MAVFLEVGSCVYILMIAKQGIDLAFTSKLIYRAFQNKRNPMGE